MVVQIALGFGILLVVLGIIGMLVNGIKSVYQGKQDWKKITSVVIPFIVYGVAYATTQEFTEAGIATMIFMIAVMLLLMVLTGLRTTLNL
jgi:hypothetical protein